jgi:hypothetical protein
VRVRTCSAALGAAILLDYLADGALEKRFAGVILIASPYIGEGGWPSKELRPTAELVAKLPVGTPIAPDEPTTTRLQGVDPGR